MGDRQRHPGDDIIQTGRRDRDRQGDIIQMGNWRYIEMGNMIEMFETINLLGVGQSWATMGSSIEKDNAI